MPPGGARRPIRLPRSIPEADRRPCRPQQPFVGGRKAEIGHAGEFEAAFPDLPFEWLPTRGGDDMVFVLRRKDL